MTNKLVVVQFLNWVFFLTSSVILVWCADGSFALIADRVSKAASQLICDFAIGDFYLSQCSLPKAILGLDVIVW